MADFLLELFSEEIPARMQRRAAEDLRQGFATALGSAGLEAQRIDVFVTPRRLALLAHGLPDATAAVSEERRGPRADAPAQAVEGFLKSTGRSRAQLEERDDPKGRFLYAVIERAGRPTAGMLAELVPALVTGFAWPKSMRWGEASADEGSFRWVRPLQSIVALLDGDVVPLTVAGVASGRTTRGHRFLHDGAVEIATPAAYAATLRAAHVIVDPLERQSVIADHAARLAADAGLELIDDEGLLVENAGLTEWPVPLLGSFDPAFLDVPPEVIQLTMRANQKYFALRKPGSNGLAPNFICVANITASDGGKAIVAGNQKVLAARLSDAKFFWDQDRKQPLESYLPKLSDIVFHEKLGTVADKVGRVAKLARWLANFIPDCDPNLAEHAARLAKADLVTGMVGEFPELQGIMGGYYARAHGMPLALSEAICDHYKPMGRWDAVPLAPTTVAVSLADKLDTIGLFFAIGARPTGSKDPFALRRAMIGVITTIVEAGLRLDLGEAVQEAYRIFLEAPVHCQGWEYVSHENSIERLMTPAGEQEGPLPISAAFGDLVETVILHKEALHARVGERKKTSRRFRLFGCGQTESDVIDFAIDRLRVQQRDVGIRHDLIDATLVPWERLDISLFVSKVHALQSFISSAEGADLLAGYKRAANILRAEGYDALERPVGQLPKLRLVGETDEPPSALQKSVDQSLLTLPQEIELAREVESVRAEAGLAVETEDFASAMAALSRLRPAVDAFFNHVTVNDAQAEVRINRLNLLNRIREAVHAVADFSKIEG